MADVVTSMNALLKEVYAETGGEIPDLVPQMLKVQKEIKFSQQDMIGEKYVVPVRLALPSGITQAVGDGTAGAFSLNDAKGGTTKKAKVPGAQFVLRDVMSYEDASKAVQGKRAFKSATGFFFEGIQKAMKKALEIDLLYGASGTVANTALGTVTSYSNPTITVSTSTWAAGIWAGSEGMEVSVYNGSTERGSSTISSVDLEARTITLAADVSGTTSGDKLFRKTAYGDSMDGIHSILVNTGTLFEISAATYNLWKGTSHSVGSAAFSFNALKKGISKAVNKGLDSDLLLLLNPGAWDDLATDISSLRRTDSGDIKKVDIGTEEIVYHSQNGATRIVAHNCVKEGFGYGLKLDSWKRIGSTDVSFKDMARGGDIFFHLEGKAGIEARGYTNQAIVCETPAQNILFTGIVNS